MAKNDEWISVSEAAEISGYNPEYIRRLIRDRDIEGKKFSIVWQVRRESLLDYIESAKAQSDKRYTPKPKT